MSKKSITYFAIALGMSVFPFANAAHYYNTHSSISDNTPSYSNSNTISDKDLAKKIHDRLNAGLVKNSYNDVTVQVSNGDVTLGGTVTAPSDKDKAEKEVRNIEGVRNVDNQIRIQQPDQGYNDPSSKQTNSRAYTNNSSNKDFPQDTFATANDEQLNKKIRDKVSRGWLWNDYKDIVLHTDNGVVTVEGSVETTSDQQKIIHELQRVNGVKSVQSNLTVKKQ